VNKPPTIRTVAAALDLSPAMTHKLVRQGMPIAEGVEACRRWRAANVRTRPHLTRAAAPTDGPAAGETFTHWRMRREKALALAAEVDLEERLGTVVATDAVVEAVARRCAAAKAMLMSVPGRLAPLVAGMDALSAQHFLDDEMRRALDELASLVFDVQPKLKKGKPHE
jgi:hypothetical protein